MIYCYCLLQTFLPVFVCVSKANVWHGRLSVVRPSSDELLTANFVERHLFTISWPFFRFSKFWFFFFLFCFVFCFRFNNLGFHFRYHGSIWRREMLKRYSSHSYDSFSIKLLWLFLVTGLTKVAYRNFENSNFYFLEKKDWNLTLWSVTKFQNSTPSTVVFNHFWNVLCRRLHLWKNTTLP